MFSNIFYFPSYLGKISNLINIFQSGWNHQLDIHATTVQKRCAMICKASAVARISALAIASIGLLKLGVNEVFFFLGSQWHTLARRYIISQYILRKYRSWGATIYIYIYIITWLCILFHVLIIRWCYCFYWCVQGDRCIMVTTARWYATCVVA